MPIYASPENFGSPESIRTRQEDSPLSYRPVLTEEVAKVLENYIKLCISDTSRLSNPHLNYLTESSDSVEVVYSLTPDRKESFPKIHIIPFPYKTVQGPSSVQEAGINVVMKGKQMSKNLAAFMTGTCQLIIRTENREQGRAIQSELLLDLIRDKSYLQSEMNIKSFTVNTENSLESEETTDTGDSKIPGGGFPHYLSVSWLASVMTSTWDDRPFI